MKFIADLLTLGGQMLVMQLKQWLRLKTVLLVYCVKIVLWEGIRISNEMGKKDVQFVRLVSMLRMEIKRLVKF